MHYGTWDDPECSCYDILPEDLIYARTYECKYFVHDKESIDNLLFNEDLKPKYK